MIYLDYAATTPLDPSVLKKMLPFFSTNFANPASVHTPGQTALKALDDARYRIAELLDISGHDITFTSGATEANNLTLYGVTAAHGNLKKQHIITTAVEHDSILEPLRALELHGLKVSYLPVNQQGLISPEHVISALRPETILVSIGYVNSETGNVQPLKQIGRKLRNYNEQRLKLWQNTPARKRGDKPQRVLFHSDATQALNFQDCRPKVLNLDLMSLSAHKIYGPKGIGLLYASSSLALTPLFFGGHQERNRRSGTVNLPAVIGFAEALHLVLKQRPALTRSISQLRDTLLYGILKALPEAIVNSSENANPAHLNISFPGLEGDLLQAALDERGVAVSTGSACASGDIDASMVLTAMGRDTATARSAIRYTLGRHTRINDINSAIKATVSAVKALTQQK